MTVLVKKPENLINLEGEVYQWALGKLEDDLNDPRFVKDNPGIDSDVEEQVNDLIHRMNDELPEILFGDAVWSEFVAAGKRAAHKLQELYP